MDQWLTRSASNFIAGPYTRDQVVHLIREGILGLQDEVCPGNGYWIYLHEHEEVQRQLGIQVPRTGASGLKRDEEEITETQTETSDVPTPTSGRSSAQGSTQVVRRHPPIVNVAGTSVERPSLWRGVAWFLIVTVSVLVVMVLKVLRSAG